MGDLTLIVETVFALDDENLQVRCVVYLFKLCFNSLANLPLRRENMDGRAGCLTFHTVEFLFERRIVQYTQGAERICGSTGW